MLLYLVRHGTASRAGPHTDADRPLTRSGEVELEQAARGLRVLAVRPQHVLTSPALRCRQSGELLARVLGLQPEALHALEEMASGASPQGLLEAVAPWAPGQNVLLVGHAPDLVALAGFLLDAASLELRFECGSCACFEIDALPPTGTSRLLWHSTPAQLRMLGKLEKQR